MATRPLIALVGPTASGKTALAVELCRRFNGEVVSADSMQVYEDLYVGTARPTVEEMQGIPHHLMGFLPLNASFSVAKYAEAAHDVIADVHARGKLPVLCGGTGLYVQAVTENLTYEDQQEDRSLRDALQQRIRDEGIDTVFAELQIVDPDTAARLHKNDHSRIVRALELYHTTGRTVTEQNALSHTRPSPYRVCGLLLDFRDREVLYDRINRRADTMLQQGLLDEARRLRACEGADTVTQAIGYKELYAYFDGECSLKEAMERMTRATRRYAKRQLSWFHHHGEFTPLYVDELKDSTADVAAELIQTFISK